MSIIIMVLEKTDDNSFLHFIAMHIITRERENNQEKRFWKFTHSFQRWIFPLGV